MGLLTGKCASKGYCSGEAVVKKSVALKLTGAAITDTAAEIARLRAAQDAFEARLKQLANETESPDAAGIFGVYMSIVRDEDFFKKAISRVESEKIGIEYAVYDECKNVTALFDALDDDYMRERAIDAKNVCTELIHIMMGVSNDFARKMAGRRDVVLVADDLTPSETVKLDKKVLRGIVTEHGGSTSHTVILIKAMGIPAIIGAKHVCETVRDGDFIQVDAFRGEININPDEAERKAFEALEAEYARKNICYSLAAHSPAVTKDGCCVAVKINSGDSGSMSEFDSESCDGIGLFRTEFIYMDSISYPGEDVQFSIYKKIAERASGKDVVIRTLDIGGGKSAAYMNLPREENPSLGYRAIRLCLGRPDVFSVQLRAILRASAFGNIKIMFPMIASMEEFLEAKARVEAEKQKLRERGAAFNENIPIGIMIETPAAVMISDKLAEEAAFFSVGSNDLIQYLTAADRTNERVQNLYDSCNISVLRSIKSVADSAIRAGIPWGICGEVASDERLVPLWIALGVNELSVARSSVGVIKRVIASVHRRTAQNELLRALDFGLIDDVKAHLDAFLSGLEF